MCLDYDRQATAAYRRRHKGHKTVRVWKTLTVIRSLGHRQLRGEYYSPPQGWWYPGLHTSDRKKREISEEEREELAVYHGFHVFLRREDALADNSGPMGRNMTVVPFTARLAHLVACDTTCRHAVFMKLTLSKQTRTKALCQGG